MDSSVQSVRSSLVETEIPVQVMARSNVSEKSVGASGSSLGGIREVSLQKRPKFWAVGGGKGGVGKTLISASFALNLAKRGHKVIAVDMDLGGANLHTCLGIDPPQTGIGDWAIGRQNDLKQVLFQTSNSNLNIIAATNDPLRIIGLMEKRRDELMKALSVLPADHIIMDLGAGTQDLTTDFFVNADEGILSILPEPTSVENAYRFIRAVFFKKLRMADVPKGIHEVIDAATDQKNVLGIRTPSDLLAIVDRMDEKAGLALRQKVAEFRPHIVINQVRSQVDVDIGRAICSVCRRYFGIDLHYSGYIDYDNTVWKSVRNRKPVIEEYPHSALATRMDHMTRALLGEERGLFP